MNRFLNSVVVILAALGSVGCGSLSRPHPNDQFACCSSRPGTRSASAKPLYEQHALWQTDTGQTIRLNQFEGAPVVVAMFYTSCQVACPVTITRLKQIERSLPKGICSRMRFVLITFDPEVDRPEVLQAFRRSAQLPEEWWLLRGTHADTLEIAARLGFWFERENYRLIHSNSIAVVDPNGRTLYQLEGLHSPVEPLVRALESAVQHSAALEP